MDELQIKAHIAAKTDTRDEMLRLMDHINNLNSNVGLSKSTMDELQAKISSRVAQCERSIQDHAKLLYEGAKIVIRKDDLIDLSGPITTC